MTNKNMFSGLKLKQTSTSNKERKIGKSSDPDFRSTTIYLRRKTIKKAQVKLIEKDLDFSDLVENLVQNWIDKN